VPTHAERTTTGPRRCRRSGFNREFADNSDCCDYFVPINWIQTVPETEAVHETGFFGNQNTVCKPMTPKWRATVDRLKLKFREFDKA
jgi:hypothetical protein